MKTNLTRLTFILGWLVALGPLAYAQPTISIVATDATSAETWPGQTPDTGAVRLSRTGSTASSFTVNMRLRGDAVFGADYTTTPAFGSTLTFPAGQSDINLTITPIDNLTPQLTRTVRVEIQSPNVAGQYLVAGQGRAEVTIADNDDPNTPLRANVNIAVLNGPAAEGTNGAPISGAFRIMRDANTNVAVTVAYSLGGTATPVADYAPLAGNVTMPAGISYADVVIAPVDDTIFEGSEMVTLTLLPSSCPGIFPPPPECYTVGASATASLTILDNEIPPPPPTVTFNVAQDATVFGFPAKVNGSFSAASSNGFIASYSVRLDGVVKFSGNTDYPNAPAPGTPFDFAFTLTNLTGGSHQFQASVTDDQGLSTTTNRTLFIVALQPPPPPPASYSIVALDAEAAETLPGEPLNPGRFLFTRTGTPGDLEFFGYSFTGSAREGVDYTISHGAWTSTWQGVTNIVTQEITINPVDDFFIEGTETVKMELCFPIIVIIYGVGAPIGTSCTGDTPGLNATINLYDNDTTPPPYPVVTVAATDADAAEVSTLSGNPQNPGMFTLTRTAPTTNELRVNYSLGGTAKNGVDYETLSGMALFPTGATSVGIAVNPIFDTFVEGNESVTLTLRPPPTNASPTFLLDPSGQNSASVILRDYAPANIPVVSVFASDVQAIEENVYSRTAAFTVSRIGGLATNVTVPYTLDGTASNGVDYVTLPGLVTITAITPSTTIIVNPIADGLTEPVETVGLTLQPPSPDIFPPPYLFSAAPNQHTMAGVTIRDTALYPGHPYLTRAQRVFLRRHPNRHVVVPLPPTVFNNPLVAPPTNAPAVTWAIEASPDMATWAEIGTTTDPEEFVDVTAGDAPQRFYRFRQVTPAGP